MSIENKVKTPKGMYAVCVWDPSNPRKSIPTIVETQTTGRDAIYASEKYASWYATIRNKQWYKEVKEKERKGQPVIGETEYFVIDDQEMRIF